MEAWGLQKSTLGGLAALESQLKKICSGGQTGVDRAALDVALYLQMPHGGWCPRGRRSEDGPIADQYQLRETESTDYSVRTERNIIDADGTLILHHGSLSGGTKLTWKLAKRHHSPVLKIDLASQNFAISVPAFWDWVEQQQIATLNVAGPRESSCAGIGELARRFLLALFDCDVGRDANANPFP